MIFSDWNGKWAYGDDNSWSSLEKSKVELLKGRMHHNGSFWMEFRSVDRFIKLLSPYKMTI